MYVNHERKLIYLAQPRTGSRAVGRYLLDELGFEIPDKGLASPCAQWGAHHGYQKDLFQDLKKGAGYRVISCVRNPYDYLVSWYHHFNESRRNPIKFIDFLLDLDWQLHPFGPRAGSLFWALQPLSDGVFKYEQLDESLSRILDQPVEIPVFAPSKERLHYRSYYNRRARWYVKGRFKRDLDDYYYNF